MLVHVLMAALVVAAIVIAGAELEHHLDAIEAGVAELGPLGVLAYVGLFAVASSLLVPDTLLCVIAGAAFGMGWGSVAGGLGFLLASAVQYGLARRVLTARIERQTAKRPRLAAIQRAVRRDQGRLQVLVRLAPLNPAAVSYVLGASGVRLGPFMVACLAHLPNLLLEIYFGYASKHLARASSTSGHGDVLHLVMLGGGLVAGIAAVAIVSRRAHQAVLEAVEGDGPSNDAAT